MTISIEGPRRRNPKRPESQIRLQQIVGVEDRLDAAEAELATLTLMARSRGIAFLKRQSPPLLDELEMLIARLRHLILDEATRGVSADIPPKRPRTPPPPSRAPAQV